MAHSHSKLTPLGRLLLVQRIVELQWSVSQAAASMGVSRQAAHKWLGRWRRAGLDGLVDRSSRPHASPRAVPDAVVQEILRLRRRLKVGPRRIAPLVGRAHSTVYAVLRRQGLSRLRQQDRSTGIPVRYVRERPGELLHIDMKALGRIPDGGGHRVLGRSAETRRRGRGIGYEVLHVAVDDASRLAFVQILPDGRGPTAARFLVEAAAFFADQGIRIERVMTDRARSYSTSQTFRDAVSGLQIRHRITRPYRPQTNGKAERFIRTLLAEWAYAQLYPSNEERRDALPKWLHYYNHHRPHTALGGRSPAAVSVNNVCGHYS